MRFPLVTPSHPLSLHLIYSIPLQVPCILPPQSVSLLSVHCLSSKVPIFHHSQILRAYATSSIMWSLSSSLPLLQHICNAALQSTANLLMVLLPLRSILIGCWGHVPIPLANHKLICRENRFYDWQGLWTCPPLWPGTRFACYWEKGHGKGYWSTKNISYHN